MWSKIYLAVLSVGVIAVTFFSYYSWSWLQSIGQPSVAVAGYEYHSGIAWTLLWLASLVLMILGNAVLWASGRSWAVWTTFVYFAVFIVIRYFWLDQEFFQFRKANGMFDGSFSVAPLFAVILVALGGTIAFFDQFIIVRLRARTYPEPAQTPAEQISPTNGEKAAE